MPNILPVSDLRNYNGYGDLSGSQAKSMHTVYGNRIQYIKLILIPRLNCHFLVDFCRNG